MSKELPFSNDELLFPDKTSVEEKVGDTESKDNNTNSKDQSSNKTKPWLARLKQRADEPTAPDVKEWERARAIAGKEGVGVFGVKRAEGKVLYLTAFIAEGNEIREFYCVRQKDAPFYQLSNRGAPGVLSMDDIINSSIFSLSQKNFNKLNTHLAAIFSEGI
jgi:hypothetical protein